MAKQTVNKSALIREYLGKHADKSPKEIAELIKADHKVEVSPNFVSATKTDLKKEGGAPKAAAAPKAKKATPAPASNGKQSAPKAAKAPAKAKGGISLHVENLKSAALALGKDEAKRIIDLL